VFKRSNDPAAASAPGETSDAVQAARTRARRRLIGAVVLLGIGIIGFPLVFETRPRPVPIDIPIEIPRKDNAPPLAMPPARGSASGATVAPAAPREETVITESSADAGREVPARPAATSTDRTAAARPAAGTSDRAAPSTGERASTSAERPAGSGERASVAAAPAASRAAPAVDRAQAVASRPTAPAEAGTGTSAAANDAARAKALLDGKPASAAESPRYVVQVGAFAEQSTANETRMKVEKLGLKTYTQVAQTPSGNRIRVRIGPFASRAEADAALAKARAGGLTAVVLTL
jgi:DedD protein